jgi:cation transport regulator ChaC
MNDPCVDIFYFAYGSNMSVKRITARVPSACVIDTATLRGHRLGFRKVGKDGSAKCDVEQTGESGNIVIGVIFKLPLADKQILDRIEGLGNGYKQKHVTVHTNKGSSVTALTYYATDINVSLSPYHWYKEHVLAGACEHRLPDDYIRMIKSVSAIHDPDPDRHDQELAIYR